MYLRELRLWNFRKYGIDGANFATAKPGLDVAFQKGLNVLIGENDSGKTTIIDAIRYTLRTQSGEYIPMDEKDFYCNKLGERAEELKIECVFDGLSEKDLGLFLEWLTLDASGSLVLKVWLFAKRVDNTIIPQFYAGSGDGTTMDGMARNMLRSVYLKPLRDALTDMTHGYKSRLAQILGAHSVFKPQKEENGQQKRHELEEIYNTLKRDIEAYFEGGKGNEISSDINERLSKHFLFDDRQAKIKLAGGELTEILRQLDLVLESNKSGLGTLNLLCMAAELLMLSQQQIGLKLVLIEELEAHLHPQFQMKVIDYIKEVSQDNKVQFILSTHSTTLASKLPLESLLICKEDKIYPMGPNYTCLEKSDYSFLERFLDATKANLFFARGVIIVEGDAENILLPAIAEAIGRPLNKYGVSIVNVGSTAYKRYAKIFQRRDGQYMGVPVAIVTDMDVPSIEHLKKYPSENFDADETKLNAARITRRQQLESMYNNGDLRVFIPNYWTLEFDIAMSSLAPRLLLAILLARMDEQDKIVDFDKAFDEAHTKVESKYSKFTITGEELACEIARPLIHRQLSKATTAQYLAEIISPRNKNEEDEMHKKDIVGVLTNSPTLQYLLEAINYATGKYKEQEQ